MKKNLARKLALGKIAKFCGPENAGIFFLKNVCNQSQQIHPKKRRQFWTNI